MEFNYKYIMKMNTQNAQTHQILQSNQTITQMLIRALDGALFMINTL